MSTTITVRGRAITVSRDSNENWPNDDIQFPRLLAEVRGVMTAHMFRELRESMNLEPAELTELFDRADEIWEKIKQVTVQQTAQAN